MRRLFFTFFLLCFLFLSTNTMFAESEIYGGEPVEDRIPQYVEVGSVVGACGGSLLSPNIVMTAYHCLDPHRFKMTHTVESVIESIRVRVGNHDTRLAEGVVLTATTFFTIGDSFTADIALIKLSRALTKTVVNTQTLIDFIAINDIASPNLGDTLHIYGRGNTGEDVRSPFTKVGTMTVSSNHVSTIFCARGMDFLGVGDSGGIATLQRLPTDNPVQYGINSTGVAGSSCFVNVYYYRDWIKQVIKDNAPVNPDYNTCVINGHLSRSKLKFQVAGYVGDFEGNHTGQFSITLPYDRNITVQSFSDNMMSSIIYLQDCADAPSFVEHGLFIPIVMRG